MTQLETFIASISSRSTSELLALWLIGDHYSALSTLYDLVASDVKSITPLIEAIAAIRTEIDRRIPCKAP